MNKIAILLVSLFFSFIAKTQDVDGLYCKDGKKSVRIELETKLPYLEMNKPTELKVYVKNIDLKSSSIVGRGVRPLGNLNKDEFFLCSVTVDEEGVKDGQYTLTFVYPDSTGNERKVCAFSIPVKVP